MKKSYLLGAALATAAFPLAAAQAATIVAGTATVSVYYGQDPALPTDDGLDIDIAMIGGGAFNTGDLEGLPGNSYSKSLFTIWSPETDVSSGEDTQHKSILVDFLFTSPGNASGSIPGETYGVRKGFFGQIQDGEVVWDSPLEIDLGALGAFSVSLSGEDFGVNRLFGEGPEDVKATFSLIRPAGAIPEPTTWAMMILGIGAIGAAMRTRRRQRVRVTYA